MFILCKWTAKGVMNAFVLKGKTQLGIRKLSHKMVIGLWFSDFLMCPEHYCDWSIQNWLVRLKAKYKPLYFLLSTVWYQNSFAFFKSFVFFYCGNPMLIQLLYNSFDICVLGSYFISQLKMKCKSTLRKQRLTKL